MLDLAPSKSRKAVIQTPIQPAQAKGRVSILRGCAGDVLGPEINQAATRFLTRHGYEIADTRGETCCGSLVHHMGREHEALDNARHNIDVWTRLIDGGGLDAILITASGCGTTIKDYGYMLRDDPAYAKKAAMVSDRAKDITEFLTGIDFEPGAPSGLTVAYHSACSMQHGQQIKDQPKELLVKAGFKVKDVPEGHICCGSAGTYNVMQPEIATQLRDRKIKNIERTKPDVIATGNIGCMTQIGGGTNIPIVHTIELLDWATGGPKPDAYSPDIKRGVRLISAHRHAGQ